MSIIFIIVYLILNFLSLKYNLHIFQLNYYMPDTQIKWTLKNWRKFLIIAVINLIGIIFTLINFKNHIILTAILLIINIVLVIEKNVKKKIIYTNRIIRMYIVNYIILFILGALLYTKFNTLIITGLVINLLTPIYMIVLNYINMPINIVLNNCFINKAKNKLKQMPNLKIIAVTGSYGKTSVKNYLTKLLSTKYNVLCTPMNFNTLLGITKTIINDLKPMHDIFVCEIGIDRVGQMDKIIKLINPDHCVITAIGSQHLETFKTQENIVKSKMKLLDGLKDNGIAFLNLDNELILNADKNREFVGYGVKNNTNNKMEITEQKYNSKGIQFIINKEGNNYSFNSKLLGEHNLINLFGAITVADYMGIDMKQMINATKYIQSVEHRLNLIPGNEYNIIDDSYNSNPVGSSNALKVLKEFDGTRIVITPGMVELGTKQYEYNYKFGALASQCCDYIILVNKEQTLPIYNALKDENYPKDNIIVEETFDEAFIKAKQIESNGKQKYILIENDLPDNY